jgi:hypothetical protein
MAGINQQRRENKEYNRITSSEALEKIAASKRSINGKKHLRND